MIFDGRPLDEITNDEIAHLVKNHVSERQHLEFKATFEYKKDAVRHELLRDIVSMANGGGGYLIIGVRDDGHGQAQCFAEPALMEKPDSMVKSIRSLCHAYISEPIDGLEIRTHDVEGNTLIIVRTPVSGRRPHMVTFQGHTNFHIRDEDGNRPMSLGEIREFFVKDPIGRRLDSIDRKLSRLTQTRMYDRHKKELSDTSQGYVSDALIRENDGHVLADVMRGRFETEVGETPYLWLAATPTNPRQGLLPLDEPEINSILASPPASRHAGWNMSGLAHSRHRSLIGVQFGVPESSYLEVLDNGHLEFWTPLDYRFCWKQSEEERRILPRLYPYPVVEYPVSFLYLTQALLQETDYADDILIQLQYRNANGYMLPSGQPNEIRFHYPAVPNTPFDESHLLLGPTPVHGTFSPDAVAFNLLKSVYRAFGADPGSIPFRDSAGTFHFE